MLHEGEYVFVTLPGRVIVPGLIPVLTFGKAEGLTLIVPRAQADRAGLDSAFRCAWITLRVRSSLAAVGLLAAAATALAAAGISCNAVSAYYHDHIFVPHDRAHETVGVLRGLAT